MNKLLKQYFCVLALLLNAIHHQEHYFCIRFTSIAILPHAVYCSLELTLQMYLFQKYEHAAPYLLLKLLQSLAQYLHTMKALRSTCLLSYHIFSLAGS